MRYLIILGVGYSGATAFADLLLSSGRVSTYPDYEEVDALRKPGGLITILRDSADKMSVYLRAFHIICGVLRILRNVCWGIVNFGLHKERISVKRRLLNFYRRFRMEILYFSLQQKILRGQLNRKSLIRQYIDGLSRICADNNTTVMLLNQVSFVEQELLRDIKDIYGSEVAVLITLRGAYGSFFELHSAIDCYVPKEDLSSSFVFGSESIKNAYVRSYLSTVINRLHSIRDFVADYDDSLVLTFEDLVLETDGVIKIISNLTDIDLSRFKQDKGRSLTRSFDANQSIGNLRSKDQVMKYFDETILTPEIIKKLDAINDLVNELSESVSPRRVS